MKSETLLQATDLTISYDQRGGSREALVGIDLTIAEADCVCIVGPSGCGKTTLLKAFGGFIAPTRGGVLYRGQHLHRPTRDIVMIFQEHNLYPWLTVEGNIGFGPRRLGIARAERQRRVDELLRVVGLEAQRRLYPHQLSGGMRQRVAIARALASAPAALLLDEPFTALDITLRRRMQQFLRELWARTGTTMLMVTHDIEEAILVGNRVIVLGGAPARVLDDVPTAAAELKDRRHPAFLALATRLEERIGADRDELVAAEPEAISGAPAAGQNEIAVAAAKG